MDSAEYEAFTIKQQVLDFAGITSLHAIPYVISTNRRIVQVRGHEWSSYKQHYLFVILYRALVLFYSFIISAVLGGSFHCSTLLSFQLFWVVVFIAATIGCGFHLSSISHTFLARDTTTSINLGYAPLAFPSVTFCTHWDTPKIPCLLQSFEDYAKASLRKSAIKMRTLMTTERFMYKTVIKYLCVLFYRYYALHKSRCGVHTLTFRVENELCYFLRSVLPYNQHLVIYYIRWETTIIQTFTM